MSKCPDCGKEFHCGAKDSTPCWCCNLPNIVPLDSDKCLCKDCLEKKIKTLQKIDIQNLDTILETLKNLKKDSQPLFGKMTAQHMIEHLIMALNFSNGKSPQHLMIDERFAKKIRYYTIETENEMSIGFKAPMLGDDLPALNYESLHAAIENLVKTIETFEFYLKNNPEVKPICPVIGELNYHEWIIFHNKHFKHHFKQFGLING